jgi:hypothetical protein
VTRSRRCRLSKVAHLCGVASCMQAALRNVLLAGKLPDDNGRRWPGRAKAETKLTAVNRSSKARLLGKF